MDSLLKQQFDALCAEFGMSANTAMNIFARAVVQQGKIPFEIKSERAAFLEKGDKAFKALMRRAENGETLESPLFFYPFLRPTVIELLDGTHGNDQNNPLPRTSNNSITASKFVVFLHPRYSESRVIRTKE